DPAFFLHGKQDSHPDVLVVWRADLSLTASLESACHDLSLCPPPQMEALPVPLHLFRNWFFQGSQKNMLDNDRGDLFEGAAKFDVFGNKDKKKGAIGHAILWQGTRNSQFIEYVADIIPGATILLPVVLGGGSQLGHIPEPPSDPATR